MGSTFAFIGRGRAGTEIDRSRHLCGRRLRLGFSGSGFLWGENELHRRLRPISVATGGLNSDRFPDLAVANQLSNNVSVLLGTGKGTFRAPRNFAAGTNPSSVAVGNLSADSFPDLAVTNQSSDNVSVFLGNGNGSFGAATNFTAGDLPVSVAISRLNGDGFPDLVVANANSNNVSVLLGVGDGSFGSATNYTSGGTPTSVAVGDLNDDTFRRPRRGQFGSRHRFGPARRRNRIIRITDGLFGRF